MGWPAGPIDTPRKWVWLSIDLRGEKGDKPTCAVMLRRFSARSLQLSMFNVRLDIRSSSGKSVTTTFRAPRIAATMLGSPAPAPSSSTSLPRTKDSACC